MGKLKNCLGCGQVFAPASNAQIYCRACAAKRYSMPKDKRVKNCRICGQEFKPMSNAQKYCKKCAFKVYGAKQTEGQSLGSLNAEARAAGMSYGQYVALKQMEKEKEQRK